jgi:hypothetical protein
LPAEIWFDRKLRIAWSQRPQYCLPNMPVVRGSGQRIAKDENQQIADCFPFCKQ